MPSERIPLPPASETVHSAPQQPSTALRDEIARIVMQQLNHGPAVVLSAEAREIADRILAIPRIREAVEIAERLPVLPTGSREWKPFV